MSNPVSNTRLDVMCIVAASSVLVLLGLTLARLGVMSHEAAPLLALGTPGLSTVLWLWLTQPSG